VKGHTLRGLDESKGKRNISKIAKVNLTKMTKK
jgi:hypothetical protein